LDISFSFLTPSLLAFRGINQQEDQQKDRKKKHAVNDNKNRKKRQDKNNSSKKKGYTAANGYFGFNAVAQLGPGIQK
jgi:hypothetical protein